MEANLMTGLSTTAVLVAGLCGLAAAAVNAQAPANGADTGAVLVTSGTGEVSLPPDRADLRLEVGTRGPTAAQASTENSTALRRVVASLNAMRMPDESVLVVGVWVRPNENRQSGALSGYTAAAVVRVTVRSLDRLGTMLDRALSAGATGIQNIAFTSNREDAGRRDALARAYGKARADAETLARAAGLRLGALIRLTTEPDYGAFGSAGMAGIVPYGSMPIAPTEVTVRATVRATWRLQR
jgi:uncharacterized protein YggE